MSFVHNNMETVELSVETRERIGKEGTAKVRQAGMVPAVLYGSTEAARSIAISDAALTKLLRKAGNRFILLDLKVKDKTGEHSEPAIIKAIQRHPVNEHIIHVDFYRVSLKQNVNVSVPIHEEGIAPGLMLGGVMQHTARSVQVRCLPTQVPDYVVADVSSLQVGGVLHARDLKMPEGVELHSDPLATILSVVAIRVEEEVVATPAEGEAAAATEAVAQPEVIGEKEREERRLKKGEEKTVKEAEKKEIKEAHKAEEKKKK
jgi:large subunit ribosomal protein L25